MCNLQISDLNLTLNPNPSDDPDPDPNPNPNSSQIVQRILQIVQTQQIAHNSAKPFYSAHQFLVWCGRLI